MPCTSCMYVLQPASCDGSYLSGSRKRSTSSRNLERIKIDSGLFEAHITLCQRLTSVHPVARHPFPCRRPIAQSLRITSTSSRHLPLQKSGCTVTMSQKRPGHNSGRFILSCDVGPEPGNHASKYCTSSYCVLTTPWPGQHQHQHQHLIHSRRHHTTFFPPRNVSERHFQGVHLGRILSA